MIVGKRYAKWLQKTGEVATTLTGRLSGMEIVLNNSGLTRMTGLRFSASGAEILRGYIPPAD